MRNLMLVVSAALVIACGREQTVPPAPEVLVFAAASLQTALEELVPIAAAETQTSLRTSYAASSALARQIESGAPADIFISADREWMDYLDEREATQRGSRADLLGNSLVLIAPAAGPVKLEVGPGFGLAAALGSDGRVALANPDVPAGRYAEAALRNLGVWESVAGRLAPAENVRAALLLVSRGEAPLGIVYRTDALADPGVMVVSTFPSSSHPPVVYPAALTARAGDEASRVLAFLRSSRAAGVFARHGFDANATAP
jgi:molybdate transport system substrate-binding protein